MSIDRLLDAFHEARGTRPEAEVVPDHACQVFEAPTPDTDTEALEAARLAVEAVLESGEGTGA